MKRPRYSRCAEGQVFGPGKRNRLVPLHTPELGDACKCAPCRGERYQKLWTPERRALASARMSKIARLPRGPRYVPSRWLPEHDRVLRELMGKLDVAGIASELTRRFSVTRTPIAVKIRLKVLGLHRLNARPWSQRDVAWQIGTGYERVRDWVQRGWLTGTPWHLGGGHRKANLSQVFTPADVERLLRAHVELVRPDQVRHAGLRTLVMAIARSGSRPRGIAS